MSCAGILYADSVSHTDSHSKHEVEEEKQSAPSGVVSFGKLSRSKSFRRLEYGSQEHRRRAMAWRMRGNTIEYIEGGAEQDEADRSRPVMGARGKAHYSDWLLT
jgi:hypothetical protein